MCVICHLPEGTEITEQELMSCWRNNSDGAGYMFIDTSGYLRIKKYMKMDQFIETFKRDFGEHAGTTPFILHFRIGTHGERSIKNVHPFVVNDHMAFCHNGVIPVRAKITDDRSDTRIFNDKVLRHLPRNFIRNPGAMNLIKMYIDTGSMTNKLAFLEKDKTVTIVNKDDGEMSEGRWFSNNSFRASRYNYSTMYDELDWGEYYSNHYPPMTSGKMYECHFCGVIVPSTYWSFIYELCYACRDKFQDLPEYKKGAFIQSIRKTFQEKTNALVPVGVTQ